MATLTPPWAAVGTDVSGVASTAEALTKGGLDWEVEHHPLYAHVYYDTEGGNRSTKHVRIPHMRSVVRMDTLAPLGAVGDIHTLVQQAEAFTPFDVLTDTEDVNLLSVGELKGGRQVFLVSELAKPFTIAGEEHRTIMFSRNQHDGRGGLMLGISALRLACWNQLPPIVRATRRGTNQQGQAAWQLRHTTTVEQRLEEAYGNLTRTINLQRNFEELANQLVLRPFGLDDMARYVEALYPTEGTKIAPRTAKRNEERQGELLAVWQGSDNLGNIRNTAYGALNAVAEWADHGFAFRGTRRATVEENRMLSTMDNQGTAYQLKERASELIFKLSAN